MKKLLSIAQQRANTTNDVVPTDITEMSQNVFRQTQTNLSLNCTKWRFFPLIVIISVIIFTTSFGITEAFASNTNKQQLQRFLCGNGLVGFKDASGKIVIPCQFIFADDFSDGLAVVMIDHKWGYINTKGELMFGGLIFEGASSFSEGFAHVWVDENTTLFINTSGQEVLKNKLWTEIHAFKEGFARVSHRGYYNFINTKGKELFDDYYLEWAGDFNQGIAPINSGYSEEKDTDECGFINTSGTVLFGGLIYDWTSNFNEGLAPVRKEYEYAFINTKGEVVFGGFIFDWAGGFSCGYADVHKGGKYGFINTKGEEVFGGYIYDFVWSFENGYAPVEKDGKWGYINTKGEVVFGGFIYDDFYSLYIVNDRARLEIDGRVIDINGKEIP